MQSPINYEIYHLHMAAFYGCCVIGVAVFGILIYSLILHRKLQSPGTVNFHEHLGIEILWNTIPLLIFVALTVPATIVLQQTYHADKTGNVKIMSNPLK